jgi:acetyl-CoA C-acetyltransferase
MIEALMAAGSDTGVTALLGRIDRVAVTQGSWTYPDPGRLVAAGVGSPSARSHLFELGVPQQAAINDALAAIVAGRSEVVAVVGGEARRWARDRAGAGHQATETAQPGTVPDVVHRRAGPPLEPIEVTHRLWEPVQQYAMIDNALRGAEEQTSAEHRAAIADLWSRFNRVAQSNPAAAFPDPMSAYHIDTPSPSNRPLSFPYNKWHAAQWTVNQAGALLLCSVEVARRTGVARDRWVFPLVGLESSHVVSLLARRRPHTWPAMGVLGRAAVTRIRRPLVDADIHEVYSCFPAAVRVQQRELGLELASTPTVTGGMTFAGGPFNNFVLQSMVSVTEGLRSDPGTLAMVTTVSGLLTKPGLGVWSARPDGEPPLVADLAGEAESMTGVVDVVAELDGFQGEATVATYTVTYAEMDPVRTVVLCDTADGRRCVAISEDADLAAHAVGHELIAHPVRVGGGSFDLL